ncbi:MAG: hypothetical protein RLZZ297_1772 [Chloroflexota bacterium]|jgi:hypothetical protein
MPRLLTPPDLLTLRHKPRALVLLHPDAGLLAAPRPFVYGLRALLSNHGHDSSLYQRDGAVSAVLHATAPSNRPVRELLAFASYGPALRYPSDHDIWYRLLEAHVIASANQQVQRVYATLNAGDDLDEIFRQSGYGCYAKQTLFRLDGPDWNQGTRVAAMQPQTRADVWGVHQLYGAVTPKPVQHAEARTARDWALPLPTPWDAVKHRAWVLHEAERVVATVRIKSSRTAHVITVMADPDFRADFADMLRHGISQIADTLPIWLSLREYQDELRWPAQDLGFHPYCEQHALVRHMTAFARSTNFARVLEPRRERGTPVPSITPIAAPPPPTQARHHGTTERHHE